MPGPSKGKGGNWALTRDRTIIIPTPALFSMCLGGTNVCLTYHSRLLRRASLLAT